MADRAWKAAERRTAALLGTTRIPSRGIAAPDMRTAALNVEHKHRKALPAWLTHAVAQAVATAGGRLPVVVLATSGRGRPTQRYVLLRFDDFVAEVMPASERNSDSQPEGVR